LAQTDLALAQTDLALAQTDLALDRVEMVDDPITGKIQVKHPGLETWLKPVRNFDRNPIGEKLRNFKLIVFLVLILYLGCVANY
jgi:hypothetical protein